jgi:perosamine synthetase
MISWWRTQFGEEEINHIADSIRNERLSQGPVTAEFERQIARLLDIPYVVAATNGSTALLMALIAAGVGPGDEVIVPNRTWIATAHAPLVLGAKTVFVDVKTDYPIMDTGRIEQSITARTKVIMPVHLNGRSVAMEDVNRIAEKHNLVVIEDAAQAFCSTNKNGFLGCQSFAGCFSLSVAKLISTGQGGFIVTRSAKTYERLNLMRTHGVGDLVNTSYTNMGFNFRFTDILASIGIEQLKQVPERIRKVKTIYSRYMAAEKELPFLKFIPVDVEAGEIPIYVEALCQNRDELVKYLAGEGVQTRPFYPDLNTAEYFKCVGNFPNSRKFGQQGVFLPCGPGQTVENIDRVIDILRLFRI